MKHLELLQRNQISWTIRILAMMLFGFTPSLRAQPVGTISAYGGDVTRLPEGYLLCDGTEYLTSQFPDLSAAIRANWGSSGPGRFKVPELRGLFLRGVNGNRRDSLADPEADKRFAFNGQGNARNEVGSIQKYALQAHVHITPTQQALLTPGPEGIDEVTNSTFGVFNADPSLQTSRPVDQNGKLIETSSETRPSNAYVYWLIKAKN